MKRKIIFMAILLLAAGAAYFSRARLAAWFGARPTSPGESAEHIAHTGAAPGERKVLYWVDPMHPAYKSDKPGNAPDCGMALEPVYADDSSTSAGTKIGRASCRERV